MDNNNANNDAIAARRRALAEALRQGEPVVVFSYWRSRFQGRNAGQWFVWHSGS